jgi:hypothetical protein
MSETITCKTSKTGQFLWQGEFEVTRSPFSGKLVMNGLKIRLKLVKPSNINVTGALELNGQVKKYEGKTGEAFHLGRMGLAPGNRVKMWGVVIDGKDDKTPPKAGTELTFEVNLDPAGGIWGD